jgi:hypothetical protein
MFKEESTLCSKKQIKKTSKWGKIKRKEARMKIPKKNNKK